MYTYYPGGYEPFILRDCKSYPFNSGRTLTELDHEIIQQLFNFKDGKISLQNAYLNILYCMQGVEV